MRFGFSAGRPQTRTRFPEIDRRKAIVDALIPLLGPLDTSHTTSNLQIEISDDSATLYAYVLAQHFMPREGSRPGSEHALLMNRYDCELVRDGRKWRFKKMVIDNAWAQGNPEILNALAIHRVLSAKPKSPE
ncbi:MAG TPA: nuclear transport factor 2 family protein [Chthoniobacterales bacterium]